jgi:hypothetical protein
LTHTGGKLIGIVFTRVPLPDLNATPTNAPAAMPPGSMPPGAIISSMPTGSTPPSATVNNNINPQMLANLQSTANLSLLNAAAANNPNVQHLQNTLRQQQMMNAAIGSPQQNQGQTNMNGKARVSNCRIYPH